MLSYRINGKNCPRYYIIPNPLMGILVLVSERSTLSGQNMEAEPHNKQESWMY